MAAARSREPCHDSFDVDLSVLGLRPEPYFAALARVSGVVDDQVDLATLETCSERVRRAVATAAERIDDLEGAYVNFMMDYEARGRV